MDLADQIDDYICTFEGIGDLTMDALAMFIFLWAVLALFLVWLCKFLYNKYYNKEKEQSQQATVISAVKSGASVATGGSGAVLTRSPSQDSGTGEKPRRSEPREILASKEIKELSRPLSSGRSSGGRTGRSGGVYVPPTPPTRKRLTRRSPGPELRKPRSVAPPSNVVGPETTTVTWTSQLFRWLYSDLVIVNELLQVWVIALNDYISKATEEQSVTAEIVRVLPESPPPGLSNIFCNCDENNPTEMVVTMDCDATPILQVKAYRQKTDKLETSHYKVTVSRFRGRLSIGMNYNTLKGDMKVEGYPDIKLAMNSVGPIKALDQDEQQLQDTISELLISALRDTIYPVDFSIYATCPRAVEMEPQESPYNMEHMNSQRRLSGPLQAVSSGKRLLVKIVKGEGLKDAQDPYCVIEMDEPPQKNQTGARQGTNPYWDEHLLFDVSPQSAEILFEVYDRPVNASDPPKFLGLGLVGIDELSVGPASSQVLALQPRPYEAQTVHGAITVEFVFIEGAEIPTGPRPYKLKEALKISTPSINEHLKNGSDLADAAVRALQEGALGGSAGNPPSKSTLIIHSVQRSPSPFKVELNKDGRIEVTETSLDQTTTVSKSETEGNSLQHDPQTDVTASPTDSYPPGGELENKDDNNLIGEEGNNVNGSLDMSSAAPPLAQSSPSPNQTSRIYQTNGNGVANHTTNSFPRNQQIEQMIEAEQDQDRGRSTQKKRDFFGTIKRRLGRSKTRAKSADRGMIPIDAENPNANGDAARSLSVDRSGGNLPNNATMGGRLIIPTLDQSRRSSLSESSAISGFSSASTKTYLHEASTLVLETIENGVKRHFLVPLAIAIRPRWRRKGTKLHIYNDHTFVAKHLSGSGLVCAICTKSIPRRPGKQGYECRDCQLICHKQCHVRAPQACSNPTILSVELSKLNSAAADRSIRKL